MKNEESNPFPRFPEGKSLLLTKNIPLPLGGVGEGLNNKQ
jgi:hypothetical protein